MFTIIQSHKTQTLLKHLGDAYSQNITNGSSIFDEFVVLVPSMVLGDWLQKEIATKYGISTLVTTTFWGQYQWQIMQSVLSKYNTKLIQNGQKDKVVNIPEVAVLSSTVMQWRLFAFMVNHYQEVLQDEQHPLFVIMKTVIGEDKKKNQDVTNNIKHSIETSHHEQDEKRLWQVAKDFAKVFNRYLTHRSEWLDGWINDIPVPVQRLIDEKDFLSQKFDVNTNLTPDWLVEHYIELEKAQRFLWRQLFSGAYQHRSQIEKNFWAGISTADVRENVKLPQCIYLFTIQQLPLSELDFLQRLSQYVDIYLFHYNPSMMFWADIVDKRWLAHQQIINPKNVYLRDYGHTLLSRLGKQSRETFASLASLSGNEDSPNFRLDWQDDFFVFDALQDSNTHSQDIFTKDSATGNSDTPLLQRLQQDVLMLEESATQYQASQQVVQALQVNDEDSFEEVLKNKPIPNNREWQLVDNYNLDDSLQIHSCYSLQRQLEVLRERIAYWLNTGVSRRQLSDIVVLLPDVESHDELIRSVFVNGVGQDGLSLPASVTGVVDKSIRQLWHAICGYYRLLGQPFSRFESRKVIDWLKLPTMVESLGLTTDQMARGCDLLIEAGFVRGFDEQHLQNTLDTDDYDYRFSFAHALDKLVLGLTMPQAKITGCLYPDANNWRTDIAEQTLPLSAVTLNDAPIIDALCRVYQSINQYRHQYSVSKSPKDWIIDIEEQIIHPLFAIYDQSKEMRSIYAAMNGFRQSLKANEQSKKYYPDYLQNQATENSQDNRHSSAASDTKTDLNLRLEFVLESIESELESQQISAEPTGVITFARFGSLRTVPYKLVVMLNMNLSEFPRQDKDDRSDLMKAGLSKRGDRSSEDDDNGAFLDALLCASENCWIFYNGKSLQDDNEHLPANPVTELLQFLQGEVKWQMMEEMIKFDSENSEPHLNDDSTLKTQIEQYLPKLIKSWLVTEHPPLPFSPRIFEKQLSEIERQIDVKGIQQLLDERLIDSKLRQQSLFPPNPLWHYVYQNIHAINNDQTLSHDVVQKLSLEQYQQMVSLLMDNRGYEQLHQQNEQILASLLSPLAMKPPTHLDIRQLVQQVRHPAIHYLNEQQVRLYGESVELERQEPLSLDGLTNYQIKDRILKSATSTFMTDKEQGVGSEIGSLEYLWYDSILPAGVARLNVLKNQQQQINHQLSEFAQTLGLSLEVSSSKEDNQINELSHLTSFISRCHEVSKILRLSIFGKHHDIQFKGQVPELIDGKHPSRWIKMLPTSASGKHLMHFWLSHIYWQSVRDTNQEQLSTNDGTSIWYFDKPNTDIKALEKRKILKLHPMAAEQAKTELAKWLMFSQLSAQCPIVIMPEYALIYLEKFYQHVAEAQHNMKSADSVNPYSYEPKANDYPRWMGNVFGQNTIYDSSSEYEAWQYILGDEPPFSALKLALMSMAEPLFSNMYSAFVAGATDEGDTSTNG